MTLIEQPLSPQYLGDVLEDHDIIARAILAEKDRRKLTTYELWKLVEEHLSKTTIYEFVQGKVNLTTASASHILAALGISMNSVTSKKSRKK